MKKQTWQILFFGLSLILLIGFINYAEKYEDHYAKLNDLFVHNLEDIRKERKEASYTLTDDIEFNSQCLFMDEDNTLYYSLTDGDFNPEVKVRKGLNIAFEGKNLNNDFISENDSLKVLVYDDKNYNEYSLKVTTLPLMNINVHNMKVVTDKDYGAFYQPMIFSLYDNEEGVNKRLIENKGEIHVRGGITQIYPKLGFRIKVKQNSYVKPEEISLLGLRSEREYILYPAYNDETRVRNVFSMGLWYDSVADDNLIGIKNGTYYKYLELFVNGKYWGLYAMCYPIDDIEVGLRKPYQNEIENLYKTSSWWDKDNVNLGEDGPVEGYKLLTNRNSNEAWKSLRDFYKTFFNSDNAEELKSLVDLENSIDIYLFYNFIQAYDSVDLGGTKYLYNTYIISRILNNRVVMTYSPWDLDRSWGKDFDDYQLLDYDENFVMELNVVHKLRTLNDPEINSMIYERYQYLRNNEWSDEAMMNKLDGYEENIFASGAYLRDLIRWPESISYDNKTGLSTIKEHVLKRAHYFDEYVEINYHN